MRNVIRRVLGKPVELTPKQQERMARMQARADAQTAEREAEARAAMAEAAKYMPGGVHSSTPSTSVGGPGTGSATPPQAPTLPTGPLDLKGILTDSFERMKDDIGAAFDDRRGVLDPGANADLNRPPAEVTDPAERERIATAERAARDAARAPYRAPNAPPITFTRFATTGARQLDDVVAHLNTTGLAAHPECVYGVYRVPTRFDMRRGAEKRTYMEWEIAHQPVPARPDPPGAAADPAVTVLGFPRDAHWVTRANGEASVVDEDVSGTFCARAALRPEDTFGLARLLHVRGRDSSDGTSWYSEIEGALLFARDRNGTLQQAHETMMSDAPLALATPRPALPFHLEILDWEAVAAWNSPSRWTPARTPAPLPHLPTDPYELLSAYLEIVGVQSADAYGVQITRSSAKLLADLSLASAKLNLKSPPKLPSADGTPRERYHVAEHVVIAYRDRADYQAGRERWRAYQRDVLRARLDHLTTERPPIEVNDNPPVSFAHEVFDSFLNPLNPVPEFPRLFNRNEKPSLGPYCGRLEDWNSC